MSKIVKRNVKEEKTDDVGMMMMDSLTPRSDDVVNRPARANSLSSQLKRLSSRRSMAASMDGEF